MFSRVVWWGTAPFQGDGTAVSDVTSRSVAIGDAIAWTAAMVLESGAGPSVISTEVSNWTGREAGDAPNSTFVSHTTVPGDGDDLVIGDAGSRFVRFRRTVVSGTSQEVYLNKLIG